MKYLILVMTLIFTFSCSGIKPLENKKFKAESVDTTKIYSQKFLDKIALIKEAYKQGKVEKAIKDLDGISEAQLNTSEVATKKNLKGVIYFSQKKYELAAKEFQIAANGAQADPILLAQAQLNLGSSHYKLNQPQRALDILSTVNYKNLNDVETKKYHQLNSVLSQQLGKSDQAIIALVRSLEDKKTINALTTDPRFVQADESFKKLTNSERVAIIEEFDDEYNLAVAYLAYKEADISFSTGDKSRMKDFTTWINARYSNNQEIKTLIDSLETRNQNNRVKIDAKVIGIAIPLSGPMKTLGERALAGMDVALEIATKHQLNGFKIEVKDTKGNAAEGAFAVKDLIEQSNVGAIIGGLNSAEATKQYLEAKKNGVLFISLSKVLLPKEEKNHLLIEIPSSVESQMAHLFDPVMLKKLGKRPAIVYPQTDIGEAYANEFWRLSKRNNLDITGIISFDTNQTDLRDPVKNILGIKFLREREAEAALVRDISALEKQKSVKRLQNLQPQIDFDWVFVPALPREAIQILPNFNYFDAFNMTFIGVPSWRSSLMLNEGFRYGNVFFMDEPITGQDSEFMSSFSSKFNKQAGFVEVLGHDAFKVYVDIIGAGTAPETRQEIDLALTKKETLKAESGTWKLFEDIWLKEVNTYKIKREGVTQI